MRRRGFFQRILAAIAAVVAPGRARAQRLDSGLRELANVVLPASLGRARIEQVAADFLVWIRDYRAGAEMPSGYGHPRTQVTPPDPSAHYAGQLAALGSPMTRESAATTAGDWPIRRSGRRNSRDHLRKRCPDYRGRNQRGDAGAEIIGAEAGRRHHHRRSGQIDLRFRESPEVPGADDALRRKSMAGRFY